jgi:hypothetical protein
MELRTGEKHYSRFYQNNECSSVEWYAQLNAEPGAIGN